jgi:hypothetical protein
MALGQQHVPCWMKFGTTCRFIEHQLAHKVKDNNGTAYNRTKFLNKRQEMMQEWADYLESLLEPI